MATKFSIEPHFYYENFIVTDMWRARSGNIHYLNVGQLSFEVLGINYCTAMRSFTKNNEETLTNYEDLNACITNCIMFVILYPAEKCGIKNINAVCSV